MHSFGNSILDAPSLPFLPLIATLGVFPPWGGLSVSPRFKILSAAFQSRSIDKTRAGHTCSRSDSDFLTRFPHRLQSCDVYFGSTFTTHPPAVRLQPRLGGRERPDAPVPTFESGEARFLARLPPEESLEGPIEGKQCRQSLVNGRTQLRGVGLRAVHRALLPEDRQRDDSHSFPYIFSYMVPAVPAWVATPPGDPPDHQGPTAGLSPPPPHS